ncbi:GspH/FimT family pseudopilin [Marinimicrobium sp. LS-A18]|uniref:GspH/FimT family pseudopilin n=1 Tax=Marinimicrobium TaxID=359337 RepID=UPI0004668153|nr:GspH/FimT family pseudopilin [Marinimicrobium sp. LS-A18]
MQRSTPTRQPGFTLIELMVTLAVLAIVLGIAIPSFNAMIRNNQSLALGDELISTLNFTRSEAVKRSDIVTLCASNADRDGCGNDWSNGWLVILDRDAGGEQGNNPTVNNDADILRDREPLANDMTITMNRGGAVTYVRFNQLGALARTDNNQVTGLARHDDCTNDSARAIRISLSGSVNSARAEC